jgi:hypothetical protein
MSEGILFYFRLGACTLKETTCIGLCGLFQLSWTFVSSWHSSRSSSRLLFCKSNKYKLMQEVLEAVATVVLLNQEYRPLPMPPVFKDALQKYVRSAECEQHK